jgi:hypothetical protein
MIYVFGIRHHGPGSARSLLRALEEVRPDAILVEGPPDAAAVLPLITHADMQPPVALLIYAASEPQRAVYYPFAEFSPEWQALHYGFTHRLEVRFCDLPQAHALALVVDEQPLATSKVPPPGSPTPLHVDPLLHLAQAAGYDDGERWWEHMVEQRQESTDLFAAILEAMQALRTQAEREQDNHGSAPVHSHTRGDTSGLREAYMRQSIRAAHRDGLRRIAVICGAWHAPALASLPAAKEDTALLKGLPKIKVEATWVPWSYGRLTAASGYGAGILSPGWYEHLWQMGKCYGGMPTYAAQVTSRWLTRVAHLLRAQDLEVSSAHVIEAIRLAETLAALRGRPVPDLTDLSEATQSVLCSGQTTPMQLIAEQLIVGERMGHVPAATPLTPLQQDLQRAQKRLRLPAQALAHTLDLDLRQPTDLGRSHMLHRLEVLGIPWGNLQQATGKGTFRELWQVQWQPEFAIRLIEASIWGNTLLAAATAYLRHTATQDAPLPTLTALLNRALLADLPQAIGSIMQQLQAQSALIGDITLLMEALPPLAQVLRYGNVRQTDAEAVGTMVAGFVARICIGLPNACATLNDDAAQDMLTQVTAVNGAVALVQAEAHTVRWHAALTQVADRPGVHGLIAGLCCRLLLEHAVFAPEEAARRLGFALSPANDPLPAAAWIEGFLQGSGQLLLYDDTLWHVVDSWVMSLAPAAFTPMLPLLRRTFARFTAPERRQIAARVSRGTSQPQWHAEPGEAPHDFDQEQADRALPLLAQLLGITYESSAER